MGLSFGHNLPVSVIIPTRKLNDITTSNIELFISRLHNLGIKYEIIVVSNYESETPAADFKIIYNKIRNAATSRNIGIQAAGSGKGIFILLDDDIVLEENKLSELFDIVLQSDVKEIYAPYLTGHLINEDYTFNWPVKKFYSWMAGKKLTHYSQIQGKSLYSINFPPLFSENINLVEWIPGGFMIFKNFQKEEVIFDNDIFKESYYMEDFFLSNQHFLKKISIKMLPVIFEHKHDHKNIKSTLRSRYKEIVATESNRIKIQRSRSKFTNESILKYKISVLLYYFYRLKGFKPFNFISFFSVGYLLLWKNPR